MVRIEEVQAEMRLNTVIREARGTIIDVMPSGDQRIQLHTGQIVELRTLIERVPGGLKGDSVILRCTRLSKGDVWVGYRIIG